MTAAPAVTSPAAAAVAVVAVAAAAAAAVASAVAVVAAVARDQHLPLPREAARYRPDEGGREGTGAGKNTRVRVRVRARGGGEGGDKRRALGISACCHASSPFCRDTVWRRCATSLLRCIATASSFGRLGASASAGGGLARTASAMDRIAAYCSRSASRTSPPPGGWLTSAGRGRIGARLGLEALWASGKPAFGWLTSHIGLAFGDVSVWDPVRPANPDLSTWMRAVASTDGFQVMASSPPVARQAPTRRIGTRTHNAARTVVSLFAQVKQRTSARRLSVSEE